MRKLTITLALLLLIAASLLAGGPNHTGFHLFERRSLSCVSCGVESGESTSPPSAPLNLTFTSTSTDTATLDWSASTGATSYELDIYEDAAFSTGRAVLSADVGNTTTYTLTGQPAGVTLHARVRAVGAGGTSTNSTATSAAIVNRWLNCSAFSSMQFEYGAAPTNYVASTATTLWHDTSGQGWNASQSTAALAPSLDGSGVYVATSASRICLNVNRVVPAATGGRFVATKVKIAAAPFGYNSLFHGFAAGESTRTYRAYVATAYGSGVWAKLSREAQTAYSKAFGAFGTESFLGIIGRTTPSVPSCDIWADGVAVGTSTSDLSWDQTTTVTIGELFGRADADLPLGGWCYYLAMANSEPSAEEMASTPLWLDAPPRGPTIEPITASTTTTLVASWTHLAGAYGYRVDLATASGFTAGSFVPGYESRIVATSSAGGLTMDVTGYTGQTVYLRMRSAGAGGIGPSSSVTTCVVP